MDVENIRFRLMWYNLIAFKQIDPPAETRGVLFYLLFSGYQSGRFYQPVQTKGLKTKRGRKQELTKLISRDDQSKGGRCKIDNPNRPF